MLVHNVCINIKVHPVDQFQILPAGRTRTKRHSELDEKLQAVSTNLLLFSYCILFIIHSRLVLGEGIFCFTPSINPLLLFLIHQSVTFKCQKVVKCPVWFTVIKQRKAANPLNWLKEWIDYLNSLWFTSYECLSTLHQESCYKWNTWSLFSRFS